MSSFLVLAILTPPTTSCLYYDANKPSRTSVPSVVVNLVLALVFTLVNLATQIPGLVTIEIPHQDIMGP